MSRNGLKSLTEKNYFIKIFDLKSTSLDFQEF